MDEQDAPLARLYFDQDMSEAELHPLATGCAAVFSARCPGKRTANEDAAALLPLGELSGVIVVADGLGGTVAGELASKVAIGQLQAAIREAAGTDTLLRTAIINGLEQANQAVKDIGSGSATTLAAVEVNGNAIRPYHVGDSMILVVGGRGKLKLQTVSHSPVGYGVEAGLLDEIEAMHHEDRHLVSNVVGSPEMRIELGPTVKLAPRDTLILASDGLFDNVHLDEIIARVRKGSLSEVMRQLASLARQRMQQPVAGQPSKPDDLTFVVFRLNR